MRFEFPDLSSINCRAFTICGSVKNSSKTTFDKLKKIDDRSYDIVVNKKKIAAHIMVGGKSGNHLHVDLATQSFFTEIKQEPPVTKLKADDLFRDIRPLLNSSLEVGLHGHFKISTKSLPAFVRLLQDLSFKKGMVKASLVGGAMQFEGLEAEAIKWRILDKKSAQLSLKAHAELMLTENYFIDAFERLKEIFDTVLLME